MIDLSPGDTEILKILVRLSEGSENRAFDIAPGADTLDHPDWPPEVAKPNREEVRSLVNRDLLEIDKSVGPAWRFWPSKEARARFSGSSEQARAEALTDADQRLGVILDAIVDALESDPSTPLLLLRTDGPDIVRHPGWPIEPDVVGLHDLRQLEDLGLVGWVDSTQFYPTPRGRTAARSPAVFLSQLADETGDDEERSRLRRWADKIRAGDVAVSTAGSFTGYVIRIVLGLPEP